LKFASHSQLKTDICGSNILNFGPNLLRDLWFILFLVPFKSRSRVPSENNLFLSVWFPRVLFLGAVCKFAEVASKMRHTHTGCKGACGQNERRPNGLGKVPAASADKWISKSASQTHYSQTRLFYTRVLTYLFIFIPLLYLSRP